MWAPNLPKKPEKSTMVNARYATEALLDEGIDVMPLPVPEHLKGPLQ
jgi:hypothetical protein